MNRLVRAVTLCSLLFGLCHSVPRAYTQDTKESENQDPSNLTNKVVVISVRSDDLRDSRRARDLERLLQDAQNAEAEAVVFDINVSNHVAWSTQEKWLDLISEMTLPSIAFVSGSATGAGALLPLACDTIYLSDAGIIGAASTGEDPAESSDEDEKQSAAAQRNSAALSILKARARSLARKKKHRVDIAEAIADEDVELKLGEDEISTKGEILTLTSDEAVRVFEGRPLLAKGVASSVDSLLEMEKLNSELAKFTPREYSEQRNRRRLQSGKKKDKEEAQDGEEESGIFSKRDKGDYNDKVVILRIGENDLASGKSRFEFMDRTLRKAELEGARAVILDIDTPGGYAWYTKGLVLDSLQDLSFPTYSFVNPRAESAGAIIAVGTDHIYMRPAASIGSALVISGGGQDLPSASEDKVTQMAIATVRNVAELKGHNPDIAEAFVTREKEVKIGGVTYHEAGHVLNLNTIQATEVIEGRPVLAKGVAKDLADLIAQESLEGEQVNAEPLGMESVAHWIQRFSFLLIMIGLAGAYMEINSPGFGLPGLASVLAFGIFFFGNYVAGNLAGYELAVLFALGVILIALEIFLFPGAIFPGAVGAVLMIVSLGLAMVDRVDFEWQWQGLPNAGGWADLFQNSLIALAVGLIGSLVLITLLLRFLPNTKMGSVLILQEEVAGGSSLSASQDEDEVTYVGWSGTSTTDLKPSGKGDFRDQLLDVITDGEFIAKGESIRVTKHEGSRIVVSKLS